uniref:Uncharacterized protein n=1 Tax=Meloidogyne enterolobii TaxID=390850 RepID=A0A6V7XWW1_MELEN|nr:unnamed protein product [Meloidogyne enterolobii]
MQEIHDKYNGIYFKHLISILEDRQKEVAKSQKKNKKKSKKNKSGKGN